MTQEAKLTIGDILQDPNVADHIKDYIRYKNKSFTPADPVLINLQTTIKDAGLPVLTRQAAIDQLVVFARTPDPEVVEPPPPPQP